MSREALEMVCRSVSDGILAFDRENVITLCNPAAEKLLNVHAADLLGRRLDHFPATQPLVPLLEQAAGTAALPSGQHCRCQRLILPDDGLFLVITAADQTMTLVGEIVHALKAPIAAAKGFIDLAGEEGSLSEHQRGFLKRAGTSLDSMLGLVHKMLDMVWLESGSELADCEANLCVLARQAVTQLDHYAQRQGVTIELNLPDSKCLVRGDERRLEGAISNLVSNAIKYSPHGGQVNVDIHIEGERAIVWVRDQGIGIAPEQQPHLFNRFYRVRSPETQRIEGSGLGLYIVKSVIERHGGGVFVQSVPKQGSLFGFWLPYDGTCGG